MPKELIHFKTALATAARLGDTRFAPCLAQARPGLLLGSVFHDALFYAVRKRGRPLERLSHRFHGVDGEDPFGLIRMQAQHAARPYARPLATAALVGMVSHLFADAVLHPLVWHCTGHYYDADPHARSLARQRHRAMEGLMDRVACPEMFDDPKLHLRSLLAQCPDIATRGVDLDGLARLAGMERLAVGEELGAAWTLYGLIQRTCAMQPLARLLHALRPVLPDAAREVTALFHAPRLLRQAAFLEGTIEYAHPVTGERAALSLADAMDRAAKKAADCCRELERTVFDGAGPALPGIAPSMETGLPGVPAGRMTHFADPPFPDMR
ncbi:MAG: zinc dependent phospholipase C family protein [Pseudodesulfovibrio sp.]